MGTTKTCLYSEDQFYWVEIDENKKLVSSPERVSAENATDLISLIRCLVNNKLAGTAVKLSGGGSRASDEEVGDNSFAEKVLVPLFNQVIGRNDLTPDARFEFLHRALGDAPTIVRLFTNKLGKEMARAIWGDKVDRYVQNDQPAEVPTSQPPHVIQNSETQGTGPSPPASGGDGGTTNRTGNNGRAAASQDSGGQGTSSPPSKNGGDPLLLFTGQLYYQATDLEVSGRGLHFAFTRTYLNQTLYKGPLGYSWDHSYNLWLREEQEILPDGTLQNVVYRSTGQLREDRYTQILDVPIGDLPPLSSYADTVFQAPTGFFDRLEKAGDLYILETVTGVRFEYNENLYIERIVDLNRNEVTFGYDPSTLLLIRIRDPVGKEFIFDYDEMNRIQVLREPVATGGRRINYSYGDNGDLEEVDIVLKPEATASTDYRYSGPDQPFELQHNLIEIISATGQSVLENEYGSSPGTWEFNRVIRQRSADGEYLYEYGPVFESEVDPATDPTNVPQTLTLVSYPNGHLIEHQFNSQGNVVRRTEQVVSASGLPQTLIATYRYNEDGLLIEEVRTDGGAVEYRYQREAYAELSGGDASGASQAERLAFGNLLRTVERPRTGLGETRRIVTEYTYRTQGNRLASQRGPYYADLLLTPLPRQEIANVSYDYDVRGNLIKINYPDVERPDGTVQSPAPSESLYNAHGLITDVIVESAHTRYVYFPDELRSGFIREKIEDADGIQRRTRYEVDALGRVAQVTEPYGAVTNVEWTAFDTPKRVILPEVAPGASRPVISYKYNRNRQVTEVKEDLALPDGSPHADGALIQRFRYDAYGRLTQHRLGPASTPDARARRTVFNPAGLPKREIDYLGNVTLIRYDERLFTSVVMSGWGTTERVIQRTKYNRSGEPIEFVDGRGFKTITKRDGFGRPSNIRDPDGNELETEYDAAGRVILNRLRGFHPETGAKVRWAEAEFRYDAVGRLIEAINHLFIPAESGPDALLRTQYYYDRLNRLEIIVDAEGGEWRHAYDGLGRLTHGRDADGNQTKRIYDDTARTVTVIDEDIGTDDTGIPLAQFFKQVVRFDTRALPIEESDSLGNIQRRGFDSRGLQTYFADATGHECLTDYDVYGQPILYRTDQAGRDVRTELKYDANGNVTSATSPIGGTTLWDYDSLNRVTSVKRNGDLITYRYDGESNLVLQRDASGVAIQNSFTPAGLLQKVASDVSAFSPPAGFPSYTPTPVSASEFKYTPLGGVAVAQNDVATLTMRYDSLERVIEERFNGRAVSSQYDSLGRPTGLTFPDARQISFDYSNAGYLMAIRQTAAGSPFPGDPAALASRTLASIWRVGGRPVALRFDGGHLVRMNYDAGKRLVAVDWTRAADGRLFLRERNLYGNRGERRIHQLDHTARLFRYDELSRLVQAVDYSDLAPINVLSIEPPISEPDLTTAATQADVEALIASVENAIRGSSSERSFKYQLDDNTNRLRTDEQPGGGGSLTTTLYVPDTQDRYQSVGGTPIVYDRAGNLLNDGINVYRYDSYNQLAEVNTPSGMLRIFRDALARRVRIQSPAGNEEFTYAGSRLIEWRKDGVVAGQVVPLERPNQYAHLASDGKDSAPIFDVMDSVLGWVASDGTVTDRKSYDPFGQVLNSASTWPAPFGFAGYWYDNLSKTYLLAARSYHPQFGRFLQRDPLGLVDGLNLYAYSRHAPGTLTDYWGFSSNDINWSTVARGVIETATMCGLMIAGSSALVAAGLVSLPFTATVGGLYMLHSGIKSFFQRADEAFDAGKTDFDGRVMLAVLGDTLGAGATSIYEGATGRDVVTDRVFGSEERSLRLASGLASFATAVGISSVGKMLGASTRARFSGTRTPATSGASGAEAFNLHHVVRGGAGQRGIGVVRIDRSGLSTAEVNRAIAGVRDMDFQAGMNGGLVRQAPSLYRAIANRVARIARDSLDMKLDRSQAAGHLPDVAAGGSPLGPILGLPRLFNQSMGGQWNRYEHGFTFEGFTLVDKATGQILYPSMGLEHATGPITW